MNLIDYFKNLNKIKIELNSKNNSFVKYEEYPKEKKGQEETYLNELIEEEYESLIKKTEEFKSLRIEYKGYYLGRIKSTLPLQEIEKVFVTPY